MTEPGRETATSPSPWHPIAVLAAAIVLPGMGQVLVGRAVRGLQFAFFILLFGWLTSKVAPPEATFIGRHAGGVFVWCLSVLDAYRSARIRYEAWRRAV